MLLTKKNITKNIVNKFLHKIRISLYFEIWQNHFSGGTLHSKTNLNQSEMIQIAFSNQFCFYLSTYIYIVL